ncbi:hypothetical protein CPB85DRAFT_1266438 [Mucidula mucida]|nr:hypothetical protein CPB85DRAFT_1266438 [Mucidula mucida]
MKSPVPQPLPKETIKGTPTLTALLGIVQRSVAAKIFKSFVDGHNNGLDNVIPRHVLENAKGFALFTVMKAGFVFSARAGSGVVIARLDDGSWSCPSAIGTAGIGFGAQTGAELTDFLIVLNSRSAVRSFMAAGSLTLGGNMSIAVGPLGRNGEAVGSINTGGKVAAMYSYSKTRGLFGGLSVEGSVIVERQDANAQAYANPHVTAKLLLSGAIDPPPWTAPLIQTLNACTGMPGNRQWVNDGGSLDSPGYAFNGLGSSAPQTPAQLKKKKKADKTAFPPPSWGQEMQNGSYFFNEGEFADPPSNRYPTADTPSWQRDTSASNGFSTHFESDFVAPDTKQTHKASQSLSAKPVTNTSTDWFDSLDASYTASPTSMSHQRSMSLASPSSQLQWGKHDDRDPPPFISSKPELTKPLGEGVGRAIALYDFKAVESGDLSFSKGDVITILQKSDSSDDW